MAQFMQKALDKVKDAQVKNILDQAKRNVMVNAMARQALRCNPLDSDIMLGEKYIARDRNPRYSPISLSEVKGQINSYITDKWQRRWSQTGPSTAKQFFPKVNG
jgi:hypothetical protein